MDKKINISIPVYQQIATDIATKIVDRKYEIGDKIYARSAIASQYGVSPETARRAICILSDLNIVESTKGSGVIIKSYEEAYKFIKQYQEIETINNLKSEIFESVRRQIKEIDYFKDQINKLIERTDRFKSLNPFTPFEIKITEESPYINKTISEINFWHNTFTTIVAIKRNNTLLMSPGPYAIFEIDDIFYIVGDENCLERARNFLYPDK